MQHDEHVKTWRYWTEPIGLYEAYDRMCRLGICD